MQNKAMITIIGTQKYPDGNDDRQELVTVGSYYVRNGAYYILYQESEITGMEGVTTSLRVDEGHLTLNRMGAAELKQEFKPGVYHKSTYVTSYGNLWLSVLTTHLQSDLTAQGGRISLEYDLFVDDELMSHNTLTISIKGDISP